MQLLMPKERINFQPCLNQKTEVYKQQVGGSHYKQHKIQPWHIWEDYNMNPWQANALKYLLRYNDKGKPLEDLLKCKHYIDYLIANLENENVQHQSKEWKDPKEPEAGFPHL